MPSRLLSWSVVLFFSERCFPESPQAHRRCVPGNNRCLPRSVQHQPRAGKASEDSATILICPNPNIADDAQFHFVGELRAMPFITDAVKIFVLS